MDIQRAARLTAQGRYEFSDHAERERLHDKFTVNDVKGVALRGELLEDYPEDPRGSSCLMLGWAADGRPVHSVLTILPTEVVRFITVYEPIPPKWLDAWTRGEKR
jgi:hypothetical protein